MGLSYSLWFRNTTLLTYKSTTLNLKAQPDLSAPAAVSLTARLWSSSMGPMHLTAPL